MEMWPASWERAVHPWLATWLADPSEQVYRTASGGIAWWALAVPPQQPLGPRGRGLGPSTYCGALLCGSTVSSIDRNTFVYEKGPYQGPRPWDGLVPMDVYQGVAELEAEKRADRSEDQSEDECLGDRPAPWDRDGWDDRVAWAGWCDGDLGREMAVEQWW